MPLVPMSGAVRLPLQVASCCGVFLGKKMLKHQDLSFFSLFFFFCFLLATTEEGTHAMRLTRFYIRYLRKLIFNWINRITHVPSQ